MRVLITGCSKHSKGIVDCLRDNYEKESMFIVGVDCNENHLLRKGVDAIYVVPKVTDDNYIPTLIDICKKNRIEVILPYITSELTLLSSNLKKFEKEGIKVSVSNLKSLMFANDKNKLYEKFKRYMPDTIVPKSIDEIKDFIKKYGDGNTCIKLKDSCGGNGFAVIHNEKSLDINLVNKARTPRYMSEFELYKIIEHDESLLGKFMIQQLVHGTDYSTCALSDNGKLLKISGYKGYQMEYGAVVNGEIHECTAAFQIHSSIIKELKLDGNSCADFIMADNGDIYLLEVNPRLNATLPFIQKAGFNLVYDRCRLLLGKPIRTNECIRNGLRISKYYESEYF